MLPMLLLGNVVGASLFYGFLLRNPFGMGLGCAFGAGLVLAHAHDPLALAISALALVIALWRRHRLRVAAR